MNNIWAIAIIFLLGFASGSFLTLSFYVFAVYRLAQRHPGPVERIATKAERSGAKKAQKAKIISPPTDFQEAQDTITKQHVDRGEGAPLEDIT